MEFMLYDAGGRPIAYCDDGRNLYAFNGVPLAYADGDSVYAFDGEHLGWLERGWLRDHEGACVLFIEGAASGGPLLPSTQSCPPKAAKLSPRAPAYQLPKPRRPPDAARWSLRSGAQFFSRGR
jgi:hypothetical protein